MRTVAVVRIGAYAARVMRIFDTHTHIYLSEFDEDRDAVVARAAGAGVARMMLPNVDVETLPLLKKMLSGKNDGRFVAAMGLHPTSVDASYRDALDKIYSEFAAAGYRAVGEVGLDLYWDTTFVSQQTAAFEEQLKWGAEKNLPVIVHNRSAFEPAMASVKRVGWKNIVLHSFGGTPDEVRAAREVCDPYFGINGVVTFKNARLSDTVRAIGLSRILVETDAPYLSPVPYRGKRNEPSYIVNTVNMIAGILGVSPEAVADASFRNAEMVFGE